MPLRDIEFMSASYACFARIADYALTTSHVVFSDTASYVATASNAISASWAPIDDAPNSISASWASSSLSASYITSSNIRGNITAFSASWASSSISSSYAFSASYGTNFLAPRVTASYMSASVYIITNQLTASNILGNLLGTASYADFSEEASMSLAVRGLIIVNAAPDPNNTIPVISMGSGSGNESRPHATIKVNNKLYCGGWSGDLYVINDPDGDLTNVTTATSIAGDTISAICYSSVTGYLYFINGATAGARTGSIVKVDPNNINTQQILVQGLLGRGALQPICTDGNYLYTADGDQNFAFSNFEKFDINTGALLASVTWMSGSTFPDNAHASVIDPNGQYFYITTGNGQFAKVSTTDLSYTTTQLFTPINSTAVISDDIAYLNGYVYASSDAGSLTNRYLYKIKTSDLTYTVYDIGASSYGTYTDGINIYVLHNGGEIWIYYNGDTDAGPVRVALGKTNPNELWFTDGGNIVYTRFPPYIIGWDANFYRAFISLTQVGINKYPTTMLDVAGNISASSIVTPILNSDTINNSGNVNTDAVVFNSYVYASGGGATVLYPNYIETTSITASLRGTASWAISASWASPASSTYAVSASWASSSLSASWASASISSSYITASNVIGTVTSASHALTASYTLNGATSGTADTASYLTPENSYTVTDLAITSDLTNGFNNTVLLGWGAHAEGFYTTANAGYSHTEGWYTNTNASGAHAEGYYTTANGMFSHAEGNYTNASYPYSHAEGDHTLTSGMCSHAEGTNTTASGNYSHAEGSGSIAYGLFSHAEGHATIASGSGQTVVGQWNVKDNITDLFVVGGGTADNNRKDILNVTNSGIFINGNISCSVITASLLSGTASFAITASYTLTGNATPSDSASWASASISASYAITASYALNGGLSPTTTFTVITLGLSNGITASLNDGDQYIAISNGLLYTFTSSNTPAINNSATCTVFFHNTATDQTSSLAFPPAWIFMGNAPTSITSSRSAVLSLKAYYNTVIAGWSTQY